MFFINVKLNIEKDAWNWWHACNKTSYNVNWQERIDLEIVKKISGKSKAVAFQFLLPYLKKQYQNESEKLEVIRADAQARFDAEGKIALRHMEKITKYPLCHQNFTCFLTTFPRCPYDYEHGYVWLCALWPTKCYLGTFLHEVLHFQFYAYYQNLLEVQRLSKNQQENLKEALTVILNYEFLDFMCQKDNGYSSHIKLREQLEMQWQRKRDLKELVRFGAIIIDKQPK